MPLTLSPPPMNEETAKAFCAVCSWAYEAWLTHKCLFDLNPDPTATVEKKYLIPFFNRLSIITHEYALQQIAKLHDPAQQNGRLNVSINFIVQYGVWGDKDDNIKAITGRLSELWNHVKSARNRLLAHNDLEALLENEALGGFPEGEDDLYFAALQELVNAVSEKWLGKPIYPFNDLVKTDIEDFLNVLKDKKDDTHFVKN